MALKKLRKSDRYQYTCPDVIHYRKNQYRLAIWTNILSYGYIALFFGGLAALNKKYDTKTTPEPTELFLSPSDS